MFTYTHTHVRNFKRKETIQQKQQQSWTREMNPRKYRCKQMRAVLTYWTTDPK